MSSSAQSTVRPRHGQLHLALLIGGDFGAGGWREADSRVEELYDLDLYVEIAQKAERAKLDAVFRADGLHLPNALDLKPFARPDSVVQLAAVAAHTTRIGLVVTVSTTFSEPYGTARTLSTLDQISGGRVGWNVVTSKGGEENFGKTFFYPDQEQRYARADEYLQVTKALWSSWDEDALVYDRENGRYADAARIHRIEHRGEHFDVAGPLNVPPSPQLFPVLAQAGASASGRRFAATHAELVFIAASDLDSAIEYHEDLSRLLAEQGRERGSVRVLPGVKPVLAATVEQAWERFDQLAHIEDWDIELARVGRELGGVDLSVFDPDAPIPAGAFSTPVDDLHARQSRPRLLRELALGSGWTLREFVRRATIGVGHYVFVGTPEGFADELERWWRTGAVDGFNIIPATIGSIEGVFEDVIPILQNRGLFRLEYEGTTLRENLGLPTPIRVRSTGDD